MALKHATVALKHTTVHTLMLLLVILVPMATAQSLDLVYIGRSGNQPGNNRITLECRDNGFAVPSPQIWVEQSDLAHRQNVTIVSNQVGQVAIEITQDLEGLYSCSYNGMTSDTLELVAYPQANLSIPSSYVFQEGQPATINCRVMPGKLSQYYRVRWMNGSLTIATSNPYSVLQGYQLHDNFSLTINDAQPIDSGTSYQCSVTIDDPQIIGTVNIVYNQLGSITVNVYDPPSILIPPERRVITVAGGSQPNTTFTCEVTRISACTTQISWIHNGRNTSQMIGWQIQTDITSEGTIRSRLNANHLRGSDSGTIGCVVHCMVDIPNQKEPLVLRTSEFTTLSVLTGDFETVISVTTDGDMFIRINFQDGYRILDQTRLLIKFTDETGVGSRNMTSEQAFVNASHIFLELPRSRLPYQHFRVQVALQVGDEIGEFVSDGRIHDIRDNTNTYIAGSAAGGVVLIVVLLAIVICIIMLCKSRWRLEQEVRPKKIEEVIALKKDQTNKIAEIAKQLIENGQNTSEVMDAVEKGFEKINKCRVDIDSGEEAEKDEMQQILSGYVHYMKTQLTEELEKLNGKATLTS